MCTHIGVRDGGQGGAATPPPIRGVCRHTFGQRVDIIRAKHSTCLNNTNLGSVTAVNGNNSKFCYYPPPTEYGSRKMQNSVCPPPPNGCWPVRYRPCCRHVHLFALHSFLQRSTHMMSGSSAGSAGLSVCIG